VLDVSVPHVVLQCAGIDTVVRQLEPTRMPKHVRVNRILEFGAGLTLYGLRHTVAVILRECGFDERTIADALGQKTIDMARHYARGADLRPKMHGVVAAFDKSVNERRTKAVKPAGRRTVKP
jgi:hypothetical protein